MSRDRLDVLAIHQRALALLAHLDPGSPARVAAEDRETPLEPGFEQVVYFSPAFEKRSSDPAKDYGIGAMTMKFVLRGPQGAIQWMISTGWYLPHLWKGLLQDEWAWHRKHPTYGLLFLAPDPWDLGYHSPVPMYQDHTLQSRHCPYTGGLCFYGGSGLNAKPLLEPFLGGGPPAVWRELREYYRSHFENVDEATRTLWEASRERDWSQVEANDEVPREEWTRRLTENLERMREAAVLMRQPSPENRG